MASAICGTRVFIAADSFSSHCARSSTRGAAPAFRTPPRRLDRPIDVVCRPSRHARHGFFGRGRDDVDRLVAGRGLPGAVVVVLVVGIMNLSILTLCFVDGYADFRKDIHRHGRRLGPGPCGRRSDSAPAAARDSRRQRRGRQRSGAGARTEGSSRKPTSPARIRSRPPSTSRFPPSAGFTASSTPPASVRPRRCLAATALIRSTCSKRRFASTWSARST